MSRNDFVFSGDAEDLARDRDEFRKWTQRDRNTETSRAEEPDTVSALLLYLADGYETGSLAARAAAVLLFIRPDLVGARNYREIAHKLGVGPAALIRAVRLLRETVPLKGGLQPPRTSQTRLLSLGQIRARRRMLWAEHLERMAEARKIAANELAREQVRKRRNLYDLQTQRRLRTATRTLALAPHLAAAAARDMAEFDRALGIPPAVVSPLAKLLTDSLKKGGA